MFDWYRERNKDKVVLLEPGSSDGVYRIVGTSYVDSGADKYNLSGESYTLKKGIINEHSNYTYYLEKESGEFLSFSDSDDKVLTPKEEDLYLNVGILKQIIKGFMSDRDKDTTLLLMTFFAGVGAGFISAFITFIYFMS